MQERKKSTYFVGLDIGTNSVGWAVADKEYNLIKYKSHPMWGVHLFEEASLAADRRTFRTARRRIDRRQQRIKLLRELFAVAISEIDKDFFTRIDSSAVVKEAGSEPYAVFADPNYDDRHFYKQYPTIHHLISELIQSEHPHDVRLVYLACAWLLAHRGHFFSDVAKEKVDEITDFVSVYNELEAEIESHDTYFSWKHSDFDCNMIGNILKSSRTRSDKFRVLLENLQIKKEKSDNGDNESRWFDESKFLRVLCGLEVKAIDLFPNGNYTDTKICLDAEDEKIVEMLSEISEEDGALLLLMKKVFDWSVLADIIGNGKNLSDSKVQTYEKHREDLSLLKKLAKKYLSYADYGSIFRVSGLNNYVGYCGRDKQKKVGQEDFYKFLKKKFEGITVNEEDRSLIEKMNQDMAVGKFLPKQVTSDNRTIPYQLYWNEMNKLLTNAAVYLPFLNECDEYGSVKDKILSIMEFRIPYFVGPLVSAEKSKFAWMVRKAEGRILPWNIQDKVDFDASEQKFIKRMTNTCTYLPGEGVLPKHSLLYQRFEVLNFINNIHVNGTPISVECKKAIYDGVFSKGSKVSKKTILSFLKANNHYQNIDINSITGIDDNVTASLGSWKFFQPYLQARRLTEKEVEEIISSRAFMEDRSRFRKYLTKFTALDNDAIRRISAQNFQGFGRLSNAFLTTPQYDDPQSGCKLSIINMMWDYNLNLMQLLSGDYPFINWVAEERKSYYANNSSTLTERLDDMYVSNAVKRPIIRSLTILDEITRTMGHAPAKIFVEMARDASGEKKGKRTVSRRAELEKLYKQCAEEDVRQIRDELSKYDESALQRDVLYLYFMQLGKDMYTGEAITDLSLYNKEHIYPQSKVKDDSIRNNIVLVKSKINAEKTDTYPISKEIRTRMTPFWKKLVDNGLIEREKYFRLTRSTPFSEDEQWGFINRQMVETRQSTKVIAELLKERYKESEIVYVKAGLVSDFRHEFNMLKSRAVNDLHHGKDAYLNVVVGNVWHECFTKKWFYENRGEHYSIKTTAVFGYDDNGNDFDVCRRNSRGEVCWNSRVSFAIVKDTLRRNYLHMTNYAFRKSGGLFDQMPLPAASGLIPLKKGKATEVYGGYRKPAAAFFVFALSEEVGKKKPKKELTLVPVDLMIADKFLADETFAMDFVRNFIDPAKKKNFSIKFPLGLKPVKVRTIFEVDGGLRFRLNGKDSGGSKLSISLFSPLLLDSRWESYVKRLEAFSEKKRQNPYLIYSERYDKFTTAENVELYDILLQKLRQGIYAKRPVSPLQVLEKGRERFVGLPAAAQVGILLAFIAGLGTGSGAGLDLRAIGGESSNGGTKISSNFSNLKKNFTTVRIVYSDSTGLHEKLSCNLLDLI